MENKPQIFYEGYRSGDLQIRAQYEVTQQEAHQEACNFRSDCDNESDTTLQYLLKEITINGRHVRQIEKSTEIPIEILEKLQKTRSKVVHLCSSCLIDFLMASQEMELE